MDVGHSLLIESFSLLHLMRTIERANTSTYSTSLMRFMALIVWDIGTKKMKERTKTSNLIVDHFSLTFVNLSQAWMLYFFVWLQNKGKFLVWSEYYNQFGIYRPSFVSLLWLQQSNLSTPEVYSERCQTSKMECFMKIVNV